MADTWECGRRLCVRSVSAGSSPTYVVGVIGKYGVRGQLGAPSGLLEVTYKLGR